MLKDFELAQAEEENKSKGNLLTPEERAFCKQVVLGEAPHRQRAQALLAIDAGFTQPEAAIKSGLTKGQVRYWLEKFRRIRLDIFPKQVLGEDRPEVKTELVEAASGEALQVEKEKAPIPTEKKGKKKGKKKKAGKGKAKKDVKGKKKKKTKAPKGKKKQKKNKKNK
jgi:hypothetical protein